METTITKLEELEATKRELDARITRAVALASSRGIERHRTAATDTATRDSE